MIVRDPPNSFNLFFILRGSIVRQILPHILLTAGLAVVVAFVDAHFPDVFPSYGAMLFTFFGVALSIGLSFRNDACYERWWEGRRQWGQMVIDCRSLARMAQAYIDTKQPGGAEAQERLANLAIVFAHVHRHFHRGGDISGDIRRYLTFAQMERLQHVQNGPEQVLRWMSQTLADCRHRRLLSDLMIQLFEQRVTSLCASYSACERIQNTPLPFVYSLFLHRTAYLFCWLLPLGLVHELGFATPLAAAIVAYMFFGLDAVSNALENPFNQSEHNLPLSAISRGIEISVLEAQGQTELPEPIRLKDYYLD